MSEFRRRLMGKGLYVLTEKNIKAKDFKFNMADLRSKWFIPQLNKTKPFKVSIKVLNNNYNAAINIGTSNTDYYSSFNVFDTTWVYAYTYESSGIEENHYLSINIRRKDNVAPTMEDVKEYIQIIYIE